MNYGGFDTQQLGDAFWIHIYRFDTGRATLLQNHKFALDNHLIPRLEAGHHALCFGTASLLGNDKVNNPLSWNRAWAVVNYCVPDGDPEDLADQFDDVLGAGAVGLQGGDPNDENFRAVFLIVKPTPWDDQTASVVYTPFKINLINPVSLVT
jgi:hypothetical protein